MHAVPFKLKKSAAQSRCLNPLRSSSAHTAPRRGTRTRARRCLKCNHIMTPRTVFSPVLGNMLFSAYFCALFKPNPLSKAREFMIWLHFSVRAHAENNNSVAPRIPLFPPTCASPACCRGRSGWNGWPRRSGTCRTSMPKCTTSRWRGISNRSEPLSS